MALRAPILLAAGAASLWLAASASAIPSNVHVVARWNVMEKGTLKHTWSEPSSEPCDPSGDGHVNVRFASPRPGHIVIGDNGYGLGDFGWNGNLRVTGTITAVDSRVRNPPAPNGTCDVDPANPVPDTRGCGTAKLTDLMQLGTTGTRFNRHIIDGANEINALEPPEGIPNCEFGGLGGFSQVFGGGETAHQSLPIKYPSARTFARRRGTFSVSAGDTRHFNAFSTTVRHITLTFRRVR